MHRLLVSGCSQAQNADRLVDCSFCYIEAQEIEVGCKARASAPRIRLLNVETEDLMLANRDRSKEVSQRNMAKLRAILVAHQLLKC